MEETNKQAQSTKIDEIVNRPEIRAAKKAVMQAYKDVPGFSGIGITLPAEGEMPGILVLFYDTIPDNFITKIDGVPVVAKIVGPIVKQTIVSPVWADHIDDVRGA